LNAIKSSVDQYHKLETQQQDLELMLELVEEEQDEDMTLELVQSIEQLTQAVDDFELQLLLNQPYDKLNAILELHPGAGGTESQDWGLMLYRMYTRWAEKKGFKVELLDYHDGDEAGI